MNLMRRKSIKKKEIEPLIKKLLLLLLEILEIWGI